MIITLALLAITAGAVAFVARKTTVSIVINKDESIMATIKERLATLEAAQVNSAALATQADLAAVSDRVTAVETEIGADPAPEVPAAAPAIDPATGLPL